MKEVNCLFCNQKEDKVFWLENGYKGRKCNQCDLIYISPRPDEKEMAELYKKGQSGGARAIQHITYSLYKELITKHTLRFIKKFKKNGDILELGSGGGQFLTEARSRGFNPFALEINKEQADFILNQLDIKVENKTASDPNFFKEQKFDIIYHKDLLSHLHNSVRTFKNLNNKLKNDGILIFETGNSGELSKYWLKFLGKLSYPEHLYLFSNKAILKLLEFSGFELVKCYYYSIVTARLMGKLFFLFQNNKKQECNFRKRENFFKEDLSQARKGALKKLLGYISFFLTYRIGKFFPHSWPSTIIYIAQKKL